MRRSHSLAEEANEPVNVAEVQCPLLPMATVASPSHSLNASPVTGTSIVFPQDRSGMSHPLCSRADPGNIQAADVMRARSPLGRQPHDAGAPLKPRIPPGSPDGLQFPIMVPATPITPRLLAEAGAMPSSAAGILTAPGKPQNTSPGTDSEFHFVGLMQQPRKAQLPAPARSPAALSLHLSHNLAYQVWYLAKRLVN
jgi:hypothetical protein